MRDLDFRSSLLRVYASTIVFCYYWYDVLRYVTLA